MKRMTFRSRLPELLYRRKMTQKQLAEAIGMSQSAISQISNSHFCRLDVKTIEKMLNYFELEKIDDLIEVTISP